MNQPRSYPDGYVQGMPSSIAETDRGTVEEIDYLAAVRGRCSEADAIAATASAVAPAASPAGHAARPKARILVVDDERRIRLAIRVCLEAEGYEVEEAADGREAISAIVHAGPDLVLLDLAMPNLDGM